MNSEIVCPKCKGILENDGTCSCGYGKRRNTGSSKEVDRSCPWNDHGLICGRIGSMSDSTLGDGPWYCSQHYWQLRGFPVSDPGKPSISYREQWYAERGLPYEPPKLESVGNWRCMAEDSTLLLARLKSGQLGPRQREPGDDDDTPLDL